MQKNRSYNERNDMKTLLQLQEQPKRVAFTFGRFNPPTTGHEKLIKALASQGGEIMVFPSHSQDPKKDPLPTPQKNRIYEEDVSKIFKEYYD